MSKIEIIEKIKKLMLHERSARLIESFAEADAFAEQIKNLREKHQVTQEIVLDETDEYAGDGYDGDYVFTPDSPLFKSKSVLWEEDLFGFVAGYFDCRGVFNKRNNLKIVVGEKEAREKVIKSYVFLHELSVKLMEEFTTEVESGFGGFGEHRRIARFSFQMGFASAVIERLKKCKNLETELRQWKNKLGGEIGEPSDRLEQGLVKSDKIVSSKKRQKIEEVFEQMPVAEQIKQINLERNAFMIGENAGRQCELPDEIVKPAKENYEALTKIQEEIRRKQAQRYSIKFAFGYGQTAVTYTVPVQMNFNFDSEDFNE